MDEIQVFTLRSFDFESVMLEGMRVGEELSWSIENYGWDVRFSISAPRIGENEVLNKDNVRKKHLMISQCDVILFKTVEAMEYYMSEGVCYWKKSEVN
jgi:hypothetical protein